MSTAQTSSPKGDLQHLFPSPTYSDSTLSSSSLLYTPDNNMVNVKQESSDRLHHDHTSISAANAAFASAAKRSDANTTGDATDDHSLLFAHDASGIMDADMSGDAQSLSAALNFDRINADMQVAFGNGNDSLAVSSKRPTTSQPKGAFGSMLHIRADSNSGRRHSIQTLMPSADSSSSLADYASLVGPNAGARSMSISVDAFGSFAYSQNMPTDTSANMQNASGNGFLMSPPRLTVSMSSSNSPTPTPVQGFAEDAKRRRTSQVDATPERAVDHLTHQQRYLPQQTPPNMYPYQQHAHFSVGSSVDGGLETPASAQSTASPCRVRRLSLTAMDRANHIANLTANLALPGFSGEHPPRSAPPRAPADAMQRAQSQSSLIRKAADDKSTPAKTSVSGNNTTGGNATPSGNSNGKNQDVWPDDVEVAFWEGKCHDHCNIPDSLATSTVCMHAPFASARCHTCFTTIDLACAVGSAISASESPSCTSNSERNAPRRNFSFRKSNQVERARVAVQSASLTISFCNCQDALALLDCFAGEHRAGKSDISMLLRGACMNACLKLAAVSPRSPPEQWLRRRTWCFRVVPRKCCTRS